MKKKKIAVVGVRGIPATYGGIEKHCEMLYPIMAENGFDVILYARDYYCESPISEYKGVQIKTIPVPNIKGLEAFIHSFIATVYATFSNADIIHFHAQGPALFSFIPKIFSPKKKICFTCHGIDKDRAKWGKIGKFVITLGEIASAKFPHARIGVSKTLKKYYKNKYNVDMHAVYNGVFVDEPRELNSTKKFNIEPNNYFMFVGRLVPEKAAESLIKAYKNLQTDKKLLIVGDSAGTDTYVKYLKDIAAGDERVVFTSYMYGEDLKELYSNAYSYVSASKLEGLPLTVLEAMSYSLPVVLSNIPPHVEVLEQGYDVGISFDAQGTIDSCTQALKTILELPAGELEQLKISSKQAIEKVFDWKITAHQTIDIFNNLAD